MSAHRFNGSTDRKRLWSRDIDARSDRSEMLGYELYSPCRRTFGYPSRLVDPRTASQYHGGIVFNYRPCEWECTLADAHWRRCSYVRRGGTIKFSSSWVDFIGSGYVSGNMFCIFETTWKSRWPKAEVGSKKALAPYHVNSPKLWTSLQKWEHIILTM